MFRAVKCFKSAAVAGDEISVQGHGITAAHFVHRQNGKNGNNEAAADRYAGFRFAQYLA